MLNKSTTEDKKVKIDIDSLGGFLTEVSWYVNRYNTIATAHCQIMTIVTR
jgi:ATP-dependent protease ClpP protease subunit